MINSRWLFWICLAAAWSTAAVAAENIRGRVYCDANLNGLYDEADTPLAQVAVTDGVGFAFTDSEGNYAITIQDDPVLADGGLRTLSVCRPSGYRVVSGWFYQIDQINRSLGADFRLVSEEQKLPFTFVHGTDCHVPRGGPEKFLGFRRDMAALADELQFCILTGDLVNLADSHSYAQGKQQYDFFAEHAANFPVPLYCIPGNHDIAGVRDGDQSRDRTEPFYGYGAFTRRVGPLRWCFDYAGIHFVGIDFNHKDDSGWQWGVPESAVRWLESDLERLPEDTRVFLFVHSPEGEALNELIETGRFECVFKGHDHRDRIHRIGRTQIISSGSLSQIFADKDRTEGYRIVSVMKEGVDSFYRATGSERSITLNYPRYFSKVRVGDTVKGAFYDPGRDVNKLILTINGRTNELNFVRGPVCCRFEYRLDEKMTAETIEIGVRTSDGNNSWDYTGTFEIAGK